MSRRPTAFVASIVALFVVVEICAAEESARVGGEFQVNSYTSSYQTSSAVARDAAGNFVVVWVSNAQDGSNKGIFARRFAADGLAQAAEFRVNTYTSGGQSQPAVASTPGGSFVVVWQSNGQDGATYGVFGKRFDSNGTALALEFQVNTVTTASQYYPAVAVAPSGEFMVLWTSFLQDGPSRGVFGRRFTSSGSPLAVELQVSSYTTNDQFDSDIAAEADGDFIATWASSHHDVFVNTVFARRFSSTGAPGPEIVANSFTPISQQDPTVAIDGNGDFVVAWTVDYGDISGQALAARRFNSTGSPIGFEFTVNTLATSDQEEPAVGMDAVGNFVVVWQSYHTGVEIWAREFDLMGNPRGDEVQVNSRTLDSQRLPDIGMDASGDFVIAWSSTNQDGNSVGVFAQRFAHVSVLDIDGNGDVTALTDGVLVLRFLFGFTGTPLTSGAVGDDCSRCNAAAIEPYLQGLV